MLFYYFKLVLVDLYKDIVLVTCQRIFFTTLFNNINIKVVIPFSSIILEEYYIRIINIGVLTSTPFFDKTPQKIG